MGSLFGYAGWPENGSYGASKAAVINLAESLKLELEGEGIAVTIINPGFVDTPLNASYDAEEEALCHEQGALRAQDPGEASAASLTRSPSRRKCRCSSSPARSCRARSPSR